VSGDSQPYAMGSNPGYTGPSHTTPRGGVIGDGQNQLSGAGGPYHVPPRHEPEPAPLPPDTSNWSGKPNSIWNHHAGKGVDVHRDTLRDVAKALGNDLKELEAALAKVHQKGNVGRAQLGDWDAAIQIGTTLENAYSAFTQYYSELVDCYSGVIERLQKSAGIYHDAENTTDAGVRSVEASAEGGATAQNTGNSWS
jgi:hypothetical protein